MNATRFSFTGRRMRCGFLTFAQDRAKRLGLGGWGRMLSADRAEAIVIGPKPLREMFEVACTLGPATVIVETVDAQDQVIDSAPKAFSIDE